ncbi:actin-domain-containing protein [Ramicandelaber brevisporus]|nr:actin-domain-containing protein [Ramicandelaber brevisporus]
MGTYNTRAGFSGEYTPKCVIRTAVGHRRDVDSQQQQQPADNANDTSDGIESDASTKPPPEASSPASASASASASKSKYIAGALDRLFWHNQMDIRNPLNPSDGLVNDWELLECVWDYIYHGSLRCNPSDHPLIATDPVWATSKQREKMAELAFEKFGAPAFYLARDAVMAAFAAGRPSGLVVSCGGNLTSVVPVLEGIVIKKPIQLQSFAGEHLSENILTILERDIGLEGGQPRHQVGNAGVVGDIVVPPYLVSRKTLVGAGERANFSLRTGFGSESGLTASFLKAQKLKVVHEFKENVCQISERPYDAQFLASRPKRPFEFPTGYNLQFGKMALMTERGEVGSDSGDEVAAVSGAGEAARLPELRARFGGGSSISTLLSSTGSLCCCCCSSPSFSATSFSDSDDSAAAAAALPRRPPAAAPRRAVAAVALPRPLAVRERVDVPVTDSISSALTMLIALALLATLMLLVVLASDASPTSLSSTSDDDSAAAAFLAPRRVGLVDAAVVVVAVVAAFLPRAFGAGIVSSTSTSSSSSAGTVYSVGDAMLRADGRTTLPCDVCGHLRPNVSYRKPSTSGDSRSMFTPSTMYICSSSSRGLLTIAPLAGSTVTGRQTSCAYLQAAPSSLLQCRANGSTTPAHPVNSTPHSKQPTLSSIPLDGLKKNPAYASASGLAADLREAKTRCGQRTLPSVNVSSRWKTVRLLI